MYVIDRFEGKFAIISFEGGTFNLPVALLPKGICEGDIIQFEIRVDKVSTANRKEKLKQLMEELAE